jgi:hypothetical protein
VKLPTLKHWERESYLIVSKVWIQQASEATNIATLRESLVKCQQNLSLTDKRLTEAQKAWISKKEQHQESQFQKNQEEILLNIGRETKNLNRKSKKVKIKIEFRVSN